MTRSWTIELDNGINSLDRVGFETLGTLNFEANGRAVITPIMSGKRFVGGIVGKKETRVIAGRPSTRRVRVGR